RRPAGKKNVTGQRQISWDAKRRERITDTQDRPHPARFELGGKWPIGQHRIEPPGLELLAQRRRRAEALVDICVDIKVEARTRIEAKEEPALVDGTAGNAEPAPG